MLKWELYNSLVRHDNILESRSQHKLPIDIRVALKHLSLLKLSISMEIMTLAWFKGLTDELLVALSSFIPICKRITFD